MSKNSIASERNVIWWEKTIEYIFIYTMFKNSTKNKSITPLSGNWEKSLGDAIGGNKDGGLLLIEFKREEKNIEDEIDKYFSELGVEYAHDQFTRLALQSKFQNRFKRETDASISVHATSKKNQPIPRKCTPAFNQVLRNAVNIQRLIKKPNIEEYIQSRLKTKKYEHLKSRTDEISKEITFIENSTAKNTTDLLRKTVEELTTGLDKNNTTGLHSHLYIFGSVCNDELKIMQRTYSLKEDAKELEIENISYATPEKMHDYIKKFYMRGNFGKNKDSGSNGNAGKIKKELYNEKTNLLFISDEGITPISIEKFIQIYDENMSGKISIKNNASGPN